jgi:hypothetical protein
MSTLSPPVDGQDGLRAHRPLGNASRQIRVVPLTGIRRDSGKLYKVKVVGCRAGRALTLRLCTEFQGMDEYGVCRDGLWRMRTPGLPDRWLRLWGGRQSLLDLLQRYSFQDASGCVYSADPAQTTLRNAITCARLTRARPGALGPPQGAPGQGAPGVSPRVAMACLCDPRERFELEVPCHAPVRNVGVAQLSERSGICWWGAMWFALCFSPECRDTLSAHVAAIDSSASAALRVALPDMLRDAQASERLRRALFEQLRLGDDPDQPPELDGQNGYAQFSRLCKELQIPLTTLFAPAMKELRAPVTARSGSGTSCPRGAFLGVRTYRSTHMPTFELVHGGRTWRLRSAMIGSEFCGHQIALSSCCRTQRKWAVYDSDAVRRGIGPIAWDMGADAGEAAWWRALEWIMPIHNATDKTRFCDMNPMNRHPMASIEAAYGAEGATLVQSTPPSGNMAHRTVNVDWIYTAVD